MHTSSILILATSSLALLATAGPTGTNPPTAPTCGTCNPLSGQNNCDVTTSCINTGTRFHCACRAGYKASKNNNDITKQFRLNMPNFHFLVFTPEFTKCDTLCDNPFGASPQLCAEVPIQNACPV
ncbi:putative adhesin [Aspergillus homomorphus CBS 101889]|uniref:Adhesin n=1 Tax=Aspergillus homomorphus (strain CBS 101889) TaxID=1450537 RepID=A0A395HV28_ASPHC|nr:hypothetical protein BO97DRAFT_346569 [Aspergillus homomorphus CBS 101889]RAL11660.1 hypothetical protein BO97DRAFT_346569 [Aspergillus homomorphus CBS 101889]